MASVNQHLTENVHYSHITDTIIKQPQSLSCSSYAPYTDPSADGFHIVENPYDAPIAPKNAEAAVSESEPDICYSRLDRIVPNSLVQPTTDICSPEIVSSYIEPTEQPEPEDASSSHMETPSSLEEENEHPYHILEERRAEAPTTDSSSSSSGTQVPEEDGNSSEGLLESSSRSDVLQQTSDKNYDVLKSPYDHLECPESHNTIVVKYSNLEGFLKPIPTKQESLHAGGTVTDYSDDILKYSGDYERDPIYMERLQQVDSKTSPFHYQSLVLATMNPAEDYTKLQVL